MNQITYTNNDAQRSNANFLRKLDIRLQLRALKDSLISFAIGSVLGMLMNNGKFDIGVALTMFVFAYYAIWIKQTTGCGALMASAIVFGVALGIVALTWKFEAVYLTIMMALALLPFLRGLIIPVVKLCKCVFSR